MATALPLLLSKISTHVHVKYNTCVLKRRKAVAASAATRPGFYSARSAFLIQVLPEEAHGYITQSELELRNL